jgi:hypothetical protein
MGHYLYTVSKEKVNGWLRCRFPGFFGQSGGTKMSRQKRHNTAVSVLALLAGLVIVTGVVYAAVEFGDWTGPDWLDPGYQFTIDVQSSLASSTHVCIQYVINDQQADREPCTCEMPDCSPLTGVGTWTCVIPHDYPGVYIDWDMSAWTVPCQTKESQGPVGRFQTSPSAISLAWLRAESGGAQSAFLLLPAAMLLGFVTWRTTRKE